MLIGYLQACALSRRGSYLFSCKSCSLIGTGLGAVPRDNLLLHCNFNPSQRFTSLR